MKRLYMVTYAYKKHDEASNRELIKKFLDNGQAPGVVAQYERLDGKGGIFFQEAPSDEDAEKDFELTAIYSEYMEFEVTPVTPFEDALPTFMKLFG